MIGREVESREVVPLRFRLRPEGDCEAELAENLLDLLDHEGDGVLRAEPLAAARHREIYVPFGRAGCLELPVPILDPRLELRLDGVDQRPAFAQLFGGERRQLLEELRQSTGFSSKQ